MSRGKKSTIPAPRHKKATIEEEIDADMPNVVRTNHN